MIDAFLLRLETSNQLTLLVLKLLNLLHHDLVSVEFCDFLFVHLAQHLLSDLGLRDVLHSLLDVTLLNLLQLLFLQSKEKKRC